MEIKKSGTQKTKAVSSDKKQAIPFKMLPIRAKKKKDLNKRKRRTGGRVSLHFLQRKVVRVRDRDVSKEKKKKEKKKKKKKRKKGLISLYIRLYFYLSPYTYISTYRKIDRQKDR